MAEKRIKRKRRPSLLWDSVNRLTAKIYSFFTDGRIGDMLSSGDTLCKRSYIANVFNREKRRAKTALLRYPEAVMERSRVSKAIVFIRVFLASLKLNVYGAFFVFFGLTSAIASLVPIITRGMSAFDTGAVITSGIIALCAVPALFTSRSASDAIYASKTLSKIVLDFLCIPKEKLRTQRQYGGAIYTFVSAIIAMGFGALSYVIDPLYVPLAILCVILTFLVFSSPEAGVVITLAVTPFMQYFKNPKMLLLVFVSITALSYIFKVLQKRRRLLLSPEISMVLLFCGFTVIGGLFSHGGSETLIESVIKAVIILGGFFLTYNLIDSEKLLSACFKTLTVSFIVLCAVGVWESVYYGISSRIIDSVSPNISGLAEKTVLYIADNGIVFGMFAILIFPLLLAYITNGKSVKRKAIVVSICILAIITAWMRSHYEIIVALLIASVIYWMMYSHKSMTTVMFAAIPIGLVMLLYPYAVRYWYWPDVSSILMEYMPASVTNSEMHPSVIRDGFNMIIDGNLFGIGAGEHAFSSIFPSYASASSHGAQDPMSLWLEILCWSGVFGFISFFVFLIFLVKRSCGYLIDQRSKVLRTRALALFSGLVAAMLFGCVYSIWMDDRILYLFWACAGLLMGYVRIGRERDDVRATQFKDVEDAKDVEIIFYG